MAALVDTLTTQEYAQHALMDVCNALRPQHALTASLDSI